MILQGKKKTPVREVMFHCAAINTGQFDGMSAFQIFSIINQWHLEGARGRPAFKNGFGYHGLITPSGVFYAGRPHTMIGAHCIGHNEGTLGFLLIESKKIDRMGVFSDWFTQAQANLVWGLLDDLRRKGVERASGHNDYAPKLCPGFNVGDFIADNAPYHLRDLVSAVRS